MRFLLLVAGLLTAIVFLPSNLTATPGDVCFSTPPNSVEVYDILELSATIIVSGSHECFH
jgi:hypothetical protein